MTNIFHRKIFYFCYFSQLSFNFYFFATSLSHFTIVSDANAQTPSQIEMARQMGIDIEDYIEEIMIMKQALVNNTKIL